ncbi:MAG: DDE-type integrase/transposase/recombinase [Nitrososphaerales archaeon]
MSFLYGLSTRGMTERYGLIEASREAVRLWVHKLEGLLYHRPPKRRFMVAVDGTKTKLNGVWLYLWAAIDIESREILAVYASYQRSSLNAYVFLTMVMDRCLNKPILVDGGPWYPWALRQLSLPWIHVTFGPRNYIERWFRTLKERIRGFYNINSKARGLLAVNSIIGILTYSYNGLRSHQSLRAPPIRGC